MAITITIWTDDSSFMNEGTDDIWQWAESCKGTMTEEILDMSDINSWTGCADTGYQYTFDNENDALMFSLKWGHYSC